jgi:hypothetical protein
MRSIYIYWLKHSIDVASISNKETEVLFITSFPFIAVQAILSMKQLWYFLQIIMIHKRNSDVSARQKFSQVKTRFKAILESSSWADVHPQWPRRERVWPHSSNEPTQMPCSNAKIYALGQGTDTMGTCNSHHFLARIFPFSVPIQSGYDKWHDQLVT